MCQKTALLGIHYTLLADKFFRLSAYVNCHPNAVVVRVDRYVFPIACMRVKRHPVVFVMSPKRCCDTGRYVFPIDMGRYVFPIVCIRVKRQPKGLVIRV